ncbi:hypothetical protein USDA257_c57610 [Sinorhizobium fredii USDA 257]|uniref:Uncharacterized protein n=1 Tax=Sinorhizobium fredii (strain USDA 257) TaxID=1185652 RepID=I3XEG6_SINF2|nr:hypothetical protein USDA257_c57610 [Sinorhizobium fredii USDA 257]
MPSVERAPDEVGTHREEIKASAGIAPGESVEMEDQSAPPPISPLAGRCPAVQRG